MPNWSFNRIEFSCKRKQDLERLKKRMYHKNFYRDGTDNNFSFDKIIPYPKVYKQLDKLSYMRSKARDREAKKKGYGDFWKCPSSIKAEIERKFPEVKDGFNQGGYDWCSANWGTKWNSCHEEVGKIYKEDGEWKWNIIFDTAWCYPMPVLKRIAKLYPQIRMEVFAEEESRDYNLHMIFENGELIHNEDLPFPEDEE